MKLSFAGAFMCSAIIGVMALTPPAIAKTAKECRAEWTANKAANQEKGVTQKAYVAQCREADSAAKPKATAKEKAATAKEKKEKASTASGGTAAGGGKTAKECRAEWTANKAANQAKGITQKAYVADCRAGTVAAKPMAPATAPASTTTSAPAQTKPAQTTMTPPASEPAKPAPRARAERTPTASPGMGKPEAANQFAAEGQAKAHCPAGLVVWANLDSKIYHFSGYSDYGNTKQGAYMCERDATSQGMRAAKNEKHP